MKTVTIQEVIDAIAKNGLPWTRHSYLVPNENEGELPAACVLGQAAYNLKVDPEYIFLGLANIETNAPYSITAFNDDSAKDYNEAAAFAIDYLSHFDPNESFEAENLNLAKWLYDPDDD